MQMAVQQQQQHVAINLQLLLIKTPWQVILTTFVLRVSAQCNRQGRYIHWQLHRTRVCPIGCPSLAMEGRKIRKGVGETGRGGLERLTRKPQTMVFCLVSLLFDECAHCSFRNSHQMVGTIFGAFSFVQSFSVLTLETSCYLFIVSK